MTNAELNLAIAKLVYPDARVTERGKLYIKHPLSHGRSFPVPDYCNNWNDLMPLVVEHGIEVDFSYVDGDGIKWAKAEWWYKHDTDYIDTENKNPQRALAECLLKVLEAKDE